MTDYITYSLDNIYKLENLFKKKIFDNDTIHNFNKIYKEIQNKDYINPVFSKSTIYSKFPPNAHIKKNKNFKPLIRGHNAWEPNSTKNENIKIIKLLNKISKSNYNIVLNEYKSEITSCSYNSIISAINIIYNKCILDDTFQDIYITLNNDVWTLDFKYINIFSINNNYYWSINNKKNKNGPFNNYANAKKKAYKEYNFKKLFINKFITEINNIDIVLKHNVNDLVAVKNELVKLSKFISKLYFNTVLNIYTIIK